MKKKSEAKWVIETNQETFVEIAPDQDRMWQYELSEIDKPYLATLFDSEEEAEKELKNIQQEAKRKWYEFENELELEDELELEPEPSIKEEVEFETGNEFELEIEKEPDVEPEPEPLENVEVEYETIYEFYLDRQSNPAAFKVKKLTIDCRIG